MVIKKFRVGSNIRTFHCTTKCPNDVGVEMQEVVNHALNKANELITFAHETNNKEYPGIIKPNLYVYVREDSIDDINAFTDGTDIYLSAVTTFGMVSYIHDRLDTKRLNGDKLVPDGLENTTSIKIYDRILELIVAHELIHIWHSHQQWKRHTMHYLAEAESVESVFDDILHEKVDISDVSSINIDAIIDNLIIDSGGVTCQNVYDIYYIQQILELDADRGAIQLVMQKLHNDLHPYLMACYNSNEATTNQKAATMKMHGYELGITIGAAALMLGFFDKRRKISSFESLNYLLASDHPIPAIRFFEMDKVFHGMVGSMFKNDSIPKFLLNETNAFVFDILAHSGEEMSIDNCFWMPVLTREAQRFIALLNQGWNRIHDSLQSFSQIAIQEKYKKEELEVFTECIRFDITGKYIRKEK